MIPGRGLARTHSLAHIELSPLNCTLLRLARFCDGVTSWKVANEKLVLVGKDIKVSKYF